MKRYVFDLEANGLLDEASRIHCLVLKDRDTKKVLSFANQPGYNPITIGINILRSSQVIYAHNGLGYDIPVIEKILGIKLSGVRDTLIMAKMRWPEIEYVDYRLGTVPNDLIGSYSLEAFGHRLGFHKQEHSDWSQWSPEMQRRCETDVELLDKLLDKIEEAPMSETSLQIEDDFQEYIFEQERNGVPFSIDKAKLLQAPLKQRHLILTQELQSIVPPKIVGKKTVPFNPGSRDQIIRFLCEKYDWEPSVFTDKNNPKLDADVLKSLSYPEAAKFLEYFQLQKLLGMLSEGENSWFKFVKDGRIHGRVDTLGTITHRCTHSRPNLAQIPSLRSFMGKEVRELFWAEDGYMVGADASGLELRMLSHYLHRFDGGAYAREVVEGDVHTSNQLAVELATRDDAKTFIYALIYGGGDETIGGIKLPLGGTIQQKLAGKKMRELFRTKIPAYGQLIDLVKSELRTRATLNGVDGRVLTIRKKHSALNTLLQNAGSVCVKLATVLAWKEARRIGIDFKPALHVHDEWQSITKTMKDAEMLGQIKVRSIKDAGEILKLKCPLDGQFKIGKNWAETH